jgi:hypothetical protein
MIKNSIPSFSLQTKKQKSPLRHAASRALNQRNGDQPGRFIWQLVGVLDT